MKRTNLVAPVRQRGYLLPVVLTVLVIATGLIIALMRRTEVDERIAGNTREAIGMDVAAQTVLRWCELQVTSAPRQTATLTAAATSTAAYRTATNWSGSDAIVFTGADLAGIVAEGDDAPRCIVEDATCDLQPPISDTGQVQDGCNGIDDRWRKFRLTARVTTEQDVAGLRRTQFAQSELRLYID
jgi:hypothetical protein